jgi:hypothetical protein
VAGRLSAGAGRIAKRCATLPHDFSADVTALRTANDALGLRIDARTSTPGWLGERLDVGYAIDVLHRLARGEATPTIP